MPGKICAYCLLDLEHAIAFRERCIKTNIMLMRQNLEKKQTSNKSICPFVNDNDPLSNDKSGLIELEDGCDATGSAYSQSSPQMPPRISRASIPKSVPDLQYKITSHIPSRRYFCRQCGMYFDDKSNFSRHRQRHLDETTDEENMLQTAFDLAETVFDNEQSTLPNVPATHNSYRGLQSSSQTNETIKPSKAKKTRKSESSPSSSASRAPNKRIRRLGNYFCDQCGRHFNDKANLNRHLQRHMGVKKFECPECGHKDYTQHLINLHQRIQHQGEKPYACKYCGERFANSMARLRHQR